MNIRILMTAAAASALFAGAAYAQQTTINSPTIQAAPGQPADPTNPAVSSTRATMPGANTTLDDTSRAGMEAKARLSGETLVQETTMAPEAPAASSYSGDVSATSRSSAMPAMAPSSVSMTTSTVTNGPVPDTAENRAKYGQPMSHAGKRTAAAGN